MELVIVICLFMVILLLVSEKIVINKITYRKEEPPTSPTDLPDVMGSIRPNERLPVPNAANESHKKETDVEPANFEIEIEKEGSEINILPEEMDEVFGQAPDLEEEEEEWHRYREPNGESGFATGVTFEELSTVGLLLQQEELEPSLKEQTVRIVQKIQGTELFSLLENSLENASQNIARLLDQSIGQHEEQNSSTQNKDLDGFNIGEFV